MKLLVVEDDRSVCEMLRPFLEREGTVTFVHTGSEAESLIREASWNLIILDWMLPNRSGIELCRMIRKTQDTPVILLTARGEEGDRVLGLESGADDYITKPFSPLELLARIKAIMRRYHSGPGSMADNGAAESAFPEELVEDNGERLVHKDIKVDTSTREVYVGPDKFTNLTPREFDLISLLVRYPKRVFTREQLLEAVWGYDFYGDERTVDVHIKRLRTKIGSAERPLIATVWGVGYKLEE
ncbi:DNA-binding response regulator [Paenibacillus chitinolyticus]|uniref:DNA-binding response regulator n=1 Tax=Paenibacillus chitinolyticus TaxID=79263 RepID=A0A410X2U7_9BACL|nr:response regulator transcription factor [Paenibacillus chitinolyticus]MCY9593797.1 response regulator transcription factor [Paenibacillus chitinolyticus]MCY9599302.1 response regulator transcription factor [Paenibacillus chitinolyticus]QAV20940.1 DNA-binding response regulator [Paenibacillus chitinolyticus]